MRPRGHFVQARKVSRSLEGVVKDSDSVAERAEEPEQKESTVNEEQEGLNGNQRPNKTS